MLKMVLFWVLVRLFSPLYGSRTGLSALVGPYWTDCSLSERQFPPGQMEVGQGEQGEEMGRVLGKTPVPDLAISPQVLDDAKGMFDPCSYAIALSVERPVRTVEAPAPVSLAMHPPYDAFFFCPLLSPLVRIGLVAVDRLLIAMQTGLHRLGVVHRGGCGYHAVHPSLRIAAHVGLHAEVPGVALLCAGHLGIPFTRLVLRRRRRMDDRRVHDRAFAHHHAPIRQIALCPVEQRFGQSMGFQEMAELADRRLVGHAVQVHAREAAHRFHVVEAVFHGRIRKTVPLLHEVDPEHHRSTDWAPAASRLRIVRQDGREQQVPGKHRIHFTQKAFLARFLLLMIVGHIGKTRLFHGTGPRLISFDVVAMHYAEEVPITVNINYEIKART